MANIKRKKNKNNDVLPHANVFARLMPSRIHGIGLFAIRDIKKGTDIFPDIKEKIYWIDYTKIKPLSGSIKKLYKDYCVIKDNKFGCPRSFNAINPSWYINHSSKPNLHIGGNYRVYASENIKKGYELTLDYSTFMDIKFPRTWKNR
jgi:SET domain-containing protein